MLEGAWPPGAKVAVLALVLTALAEVIALTSYVTADSQRQAVLERGLDRHLQVAEGEIIPSLALIRTELRALNVRLDYLESRLERHDVDTR